MSISKRILIGVLFVFFASCAGVSRDQGHTAAGEEGENKKERELKWARAHYERF